MPCRVTSAAVCAASCRVVLSCLCVFLALARCVSLGSLGCRPACCVCVLCVCVRWACLFCPWRLFVASVRCLCRSLRVCAPSVPFALFSASVRCLCRSCLSCCCVCALSVPFVVARALGCLCCPWRRSWLLRLRAVCAVRGCLGPAPCLSGGPSGFVCPTVAFSFFRVPASWGLGVCSGFWGFGVGAAGCSFAR